MTLILNLWTQELPTNCGWYWHKRTPTDHPVIVDVGESKYYDQLVIDEDRHGKIWLLEVGQVGGWWAGPLQPPDETDVAQVDPASC